jgi:tRNA U34 5-carboxymethylaminomethyl modifying enzyme MnmG/GidA
VAHAERQQGPGGARHALPGRPRAVSRRIRQACVENQPNLTLFQQAVDDLLLDGDRVTGVRHADGPAFFRDCVVLTAGTFLAGKIHIGDAHYRGGRAGDPPAQRWPSACASCRWASAG